MLEIERCGHCDGNGRLRSRSVPENGRLIAMFYVECGVCKCRTADCKTPREAIAAWNRRVGKSVSGYFNGIGRNGG